MLEDRRTVTVGLDVHKSSVRLAAVTRGEVLRERTLAYDHDALVGEIAASGPPTRRARNTSPDPSCTAAAAVLRAWTSKPAKQIPSDTSTLLTLRCGNQPAPYEAREHRPSPTGRTPAHTV